MFLLVGGVAIAGVKRSRTSEGVGRALARQNADPKGAGGRSCANAGTAARLDPDQRVESSNLYGLILEMASDAATQPEREASRADWGDECFSAWNHRSSGQRNAQRRCARWVGEGEGFWAGRHWHRQTVSWAETARQMIVATGMCPP